jgi:hypothetical protein
MADLDITSFAELPSKTDLASFMVAARIAWRTMKAADLNGVAETGPEAVTEAIDAMDAAAEQFVRLAELCDAGARKMEAAAARTQSRLKLVVSNPAF